MPAMSQKSSFTEIKDKDPYTQDKANVSHENSYRPTYIANETSEYTTQISKTGTSSYIYQPTKNKLCKRSFADTMTDANEQKEFLQNHSLEGIKIDSSKNIPDVCGPVSSLRISSVSNSSQNLEKCCDINHMYKTNEKSSMEVTVISPARKSANDFIFGKFIGEGSFSTVYLGIEISTKREYAIKVCEKRHIIRENKQEYIKREREVMHMLTNVPGFVNLSCTFQDNRNLFFVMTYAKNGDLLPFINKVGSLGVDCARHYGAELLLSCEQMHRRNIIHRDLKPENILLDENMHTLIADFGSAKILTINEKSLVEATLTKFSLSRPLSRTESCKDFSLSNFTKPPISTTVFDSEDTSDESSGEMIDSTFTKPALQRRRKRCGSFVGTAQYVSPEVLQNGLVTPMADLWAFGCIIYQMISGLPPFRGDSEFFIFKEILACNLEFPERFDKDAEDLVRKLLRINPAERLGALDKNCCYNSIRNHPFFSRIDFQRIRLSSPPQVYPDVQLLKVHDLDTNQLEPGLCNKQISRLLGMDLGCSLGANSENFIKSSKSQVDKAEVRAATEKFKRDVVNDKAKIILLSEQKTDKWHVFTDNEVIIKKGLVNSCRGLFARKCMLILTTGPRLVYIDPVQMVKTGEIPWGRELQVEPKNIKIFFVHTPERTYNIEDTEGFGLDWVDVIEKLHMYFFPPFINPYLKIARSFPYNFFWKVAPHSSAVSSNSPSYLTPSKKLGSYKHLRIE